MKVVREVPVLADTIFSYYDTVPDRSHFLRKYKNWRLHLILLSFFTVFDFINFINMRKSRPDHFRFPYYNTVSDVFIPTD